MTFVTPEERRMESLRMAFALIASNNRDDLPVSTEAVIAVARAIDNYVTGQAGYEDPLNGD